MRKKPKRPRSAETRKEGLRHFKSHPFLIPVTTFLVLFFFTLVALVATGGQTIGASDSHIVNLHVDGDPQVVPTRAKTVGELLERLDIKVEEKDIVEPALDAEITEHNFSVNVYKARPVMVVDEGKKTVTVTAQPTPKGVAEEAGVKVYPEDKISEVATDITANPTKAIQEGLVAEKVVIERATPIKLNLYGKAYDVRTHAETVAELMQERNIEHSIASVFPSPDTKLENDDTVFVADTNKEIDVIEEIVQPEEERLEDRSLALGQTVVKEAGRPGKRIVVYAIADDGRRRPLQTVIVKKPVKKVVAVGIKVPTISVAADKVAIMNAAGIGQADQFYADFIISHESGWRTNAINGRGCIGLGQACPGGAKPVLVSSCPDWQNDAVCQMRYWSVYAAKYGGWRGAFSVWQQQRWW